jgi:hypothetical protein
MATLNTLMLGYLRGGENVNFPITHDHLAPPRPCRSISIRSIYRGVTGVADPPALANKTHPVPLSVEAFHIEIVPPEMPLISRAFCPPNLRCGLEFFCRLLDLENLVNAG